MTRAWVYARTSGDEEDTGQDIGAQINEVTHTAETRGYEITGSSQDDGLTGESDPLHRPGFKKAMEEVGAGRADIIILRDASRFSRQHPAVALLAWRQVQAMHIPVVSLGESQLDGRVATWEGGELVEDLTGDLILYVTFHSKRSYLTDVRKGTRLAMREIKEGRRKTKSGLPVGAPRKISREEAEQADKWMKEEGLSLRQAASRLGEKRGAWTAGSAELRRKRLVSHQALADAFFHFRLEDAKWP
jgi:DNA invertase Pin-like site-specific DNA recombinase